jgi:hypothetical protein
MHSEATAGEFTLAASMKRHGAAWAMVDDAACKRLAKDSKGVAGKLAPACSVKSRPLWASGTSPGPGDCASADEASFGDGVARRAEGAVSAATAWHLGGFKTQQRDLPERGPIMSRVWPPERDGLARVAGGDDQGDGQIEAVAGLFHVGARLRMMRVGEFLMAEQTRSRDWPTATFPRR